MRKSARTQIPPFFDNDPCIRLIGSKFIIIIIFFSKYRTMSVCFIK